MSISKISRGGEPATKLLWHNQAIMACAIRCVLKERYEDLALNFARNAACERNVGKRSDFDMRERASRPVPQKLIAGFALAASVRA